MSTDPVSASTDYTDWTSICIRSIQPLLDDVLGVILQQSQSHHPPVGVNASHQVAEQARKLAGALDEMRIAAMNLPGGHVSAEVIRQVTTLLEHEAERSRTLLRTFGKMPMPVLHDTATKDLGATGEDSVAPSPT